MSEPLQWVPPPSGHRYSMHAREYSVCKVASARGWTYECWLGREQLEVGLASAEAARDWCQQHFQQQSQPQGELQC